MENSRLTAWTLSILRDAQGVTVTLGDNRRLSWHYRGARIPPSSAHPQRAQALADWIGPELAERLIASPPRSLCILYDPIDDIDAVDWEHLRLGGEGLAERFAVGRQLRSDTDQPPAIGDDLADQLRVHAGLEFPPLPNAPPGQLTPDAPGPAQAPADLARAQVLILDRRSLDDLAAGPPLPAGPRLLILHAGAALAELATWLDRGAAVLCLAPAPSSQPDALEGLLRLLGQGCSVGEAMRWLHRRCGQARWGARLYGDPDLRFVAAEPPDTRRQVTSLSFDLVGSTRLLADLGDEAYAELLADVHARCTELVRQHGGLPDDPQGDDGVMCYFGHPVALENAAVHAVHAGWDITRTVGQIGAQVRVGIATGQVVVRAGQPVGLTIHLAARLQQAAAPGTVLVSAATAQLVQQAFQLQPAQPRPALKGMAADEPVLQVIGLAAPQEDHRCDPATPIPLLGRHAELGQLLRCWQDTAGGGTRLAIVTAEAGMGKSRLVKEFRHRLVQAGIKALECRCQPETSASPYLSLADALRRWLDIASQDASLHALDKLSAALPPGARSGEPLRLLASFLGLQTQGKAPASGPMRQRLLALLVNWFRAFAGTKPCCLLIEDWHWADPSMQEFIHYLLEHTDGPGLLVVITSREEVTLPGQATPALRLGLGGLSPAAARCLVDSVCGDSPLPQRLAQRLAERGDGVPLFLEEATRMAIALGPQGWEAQESVLASVPASLQDLLTLRLDSLGPARRVAQVAAVLGRQFSLRLLTELLRVAEPLLDTSDLNTHLGALVTSGTLHATPGDLKAFRHALIRDAAYDSLWTRDRRSLHGMVVTLLQGQWPQLIEQQPELLALHLSEAGQADQAWRAWERAARLAASRSAEHEALRHLHQALGQLAQTAPGPARDRSALRLQLLLAARLLATEGYGADAVLQAYREAAALIERVDDGGARFKVEMGLQAYRFMRGDFEVSLAHGRRAADLATASGDPRQRLQAHWGLACTWFHQGHLRRTMREMEAGLRLHAPAQGTHLGIQDPGIMCMAYSAWGLWELGRPDDALQRIRLAIRESTATEQRFSQAAAQAYGVSIELLRGEYESASRHAQRCRQLCEDHGFPVWLAITRCMQGFLQCTQGAFDHGLTEMRAGHRLWLDSGSMVSQPLYLSLQAEGLLLAGQLAQAGHCLDEGMAWVERIGERQLEAELTRLRGELALCQGDSAAAEGWFRRAYGLALRRHRRAFALRSAIGLARLWAADGHPERALRLLQPLAARWQQGLQTRDLRQARLLLLELQSATAAGHPGEPDEAHPESLPGHLQPGLARPGESAAFGVVER